MSESDKNAISEIEFEVAQIERLLVTYADLLKHVQQRPPDTVEIAAVASVLHSFYNGIERIFPSIAKGIDTSVPSGERSHKELLIQMSKRTKQRNAVISRITSKRLVDYLGFRHFYRHSYSFVIDWKELEKLVVGLDIVWRQVKSDLQPFQSPISNLKS